MTTPKFIIKNPAQLQVFTTLYSAALIGVITAWESTTGASLFNPKEMAKRADEIACEAAKVFETHFPTEADMKEAEGPGDKIVVPIGTGKNPEKGENNE